MIASIIIIKTLTIGIRPQFSKELDHGLKDLGITPVNTDFYETEFKGHKLRRYYVQIRCDNKQEDALLDWLNNRFNHDVTLIY